MPKLYHEALEAWMEHDYKRALSLLEVAHAENPDNVRVHLKLAEVRSKTGHIAHAVRDYAMIADHYADNGFAVQAIAINKVIQRLAPGNPGITEKLRLLSIERGDCWSLSTTSETPSPNEAMQLSQQLSSADRMKLGFTRTPLLSSLSESELTSFIDSLELQEYEHGQVIYREGDNGDYLYLIGMGKVQLQTTLRSGGEKVYAHLRETDFFGEQSFMTRKAHTSTAIAETDVSLLVISRATFVEWVNKHPKIHHVVDNFYRDRVLRRVLAMSPLFRGIAEPLALALAEKFSGQRYYRDEIILEEGDAAQFLYMIRSGRVRVELYQQQKEGSRILGYRNEGDFFGEIALLSDSARTATVIAEEDTEVMMLSREDFNVLCKRYPPIREVLEDYRDYRMQKIITTLVIDQRRHY